MSDAVSSPVPTKRRILVKRHSLTVRLTHWINVLAILVLVLSGAQIFNAHPALYWGNISDFERPWLAMTADERAGRPVGLTKVDGRVFETTGVLGLSFKDGQPQARGFPAWATLPGYRSLAEGRRWHFFFAWLFAINGLIYLANAVFAGHLRRDLLPTRAQLKLSHIARDVMDHLRLRFPKGETARVYNVIQKATYLGVILVLLPLMVLSGLSMSPGVNAAATWLVEALGGRQSARTIHFLSGSAIVLFVVVHVVMAALSGFWNNLRAMITGRFAIEVEEETR